MPIRSVFPLRTDPSDGLIHAWGALLQDATARKFSEYGIRLPASGGGLTARAAYAAALGEAAERYAVASARPREVLRARASATPLPSLPLDELPFLSKGRVTSGASRHRRQRQEIEWVPGLSLTHNREVLVPKGLVYWDAGFTSTTNGCALRASLEEAILESLYEVVERDALMISWYCRQPGRRVDPRALLDARGGGG